VPGVHQWLKSKPPNVGLLRGGGYHKGPHAEQGECEMLAFIELAANQSASGRTYRLRVGCFIDPRWAALVLTVGRWL